MFAAILNDAVVFVGIVKYVTAVPFLSFCDCIVYVTAHCAFDAAVNVLSCAAVLNVALNDCVAVTLIGFVAFATFAVTVFVHVA